MSDNNLNRSAFRRDIDTAILLVYLAVTKGRTLMSSTTIPRQTYCPADDTGDKQDFPQSSHPYCCNALSKPT